MSEILDKAKELGKNAEYVTAGQGGDKDNDGKLDYDCSGLVLDTINKLGYITTDMSALQMPNSGFFDIIPPDQVQKGDILVTTNQLGGGHTAIVDWYNPETGSGEFFGSQNSGFNTQRFGKGAPYWKQECVFLRPKAEYRIGDELMDIIKTVMSGSIEDIISKMNAIVNQAKRTPIPPTRGCDPLILDLDGDGVETISVNSGVRFDHNGDGFIEQTGWVDSEQRCRIDSFRPLAISR